MCVVVLVCFYAWSAACTQVDPTTSKLYVTDEARAALSALEGSIGVCSVAGLYRTGKSYILNQLAGQNAGFGIGSSVQAHTKGVWVWGAPLSGGSAGAPGNILLLDTEGLSSISQTEGAHRWSLAPLILAADVVCAAKKYATRAAARRPRRQDLLPRHPPLLNVCLVRFEPAQAKATRRG